MWSQMLVGKKDEGTTRWMSADVGNHPEKSIVPAEPISLQLTAGPRRRVCLHPLPPAQVSLRVNATEVLRGVHSPAPVWVVVWAVTSLSASQKVMCVIVFRHVQT